MRTALALAFACLAGSEALAGTIALQISHGAELRGDTLRVALTLVNQGDEAAHAVTPSLRFRDAEVRGETIATLPPGQPVEATLELPAGSLLPGHWPYAITVDYADANLYPFQALSVARLAVGSPRVPRLAVFPAENPILGREGELAVRVKNLSGDERRVALRVITPEAVEASADGDAELEPWEEVELHVELTNRAALPGSRYPLFVLAEYEEGALHQSVIAETLLEIRPADAVLGRRGTYLWVAAALFGALFAALLAFRLVRR